MSTETTNTNRQPASGFTHLHVHSYYSILDGMSKIPELVDKCQRTGMNSIALTDHGNMYGVKVLLDYCNKVNSKPKKAVKECEEKIAKAKRLQEQIPQLEEDLKQTKDADEKKDIQANLDEARKEAKALAGYEADLPVLQQKAANYVPFKPIVGVEAYCARRGRLLKDKNVKVISPNGKETIVDRSGWHLILLAKNKTGYYNLCKLVSLAFIEGFYDRPRIDKDLLKQYHEGIICSSACLGGELSQLIMLGKVDEAEKSIMWFKNLFGEDYYIELQRHQTDKPGGDQTTYQKQIEVNKVLVELARKTNTKIICSNDVHFVEEEHSEAHDRLICISTGVNVDDPKRMHYTKQEWLKTPEQMAAIFSDLPEALSNTQEIVDKVEVYSIDADPIMPKFPIPEEFGTEEQYREKYTHEQLFEEFTHNEKGEVVLSQAEAEKKIQKLGGYDRLYRIKLEADYLAELAWKGAHMRYGEELTEEQIERITFELHIMKTMGFPGYFLIVQDYIRAAREELDMLVGPGRGSAAGSVVAYCLKITDVDPLQYDLLFERFLNPDRISLPDIDVDFEDTGKILEWVGNKYGNEKVARIITYGTMATKSSIADVGRVQGVPLREVNEIKSFIPDRGFPDNIKDEKGKKPKVNLRNCYKYVDELRARLNGDDKNIASMMHYAEELEDTVRQVGIHACGVIIGADDLTKFAPLATVFDKALKKDIIVTEYDGHVIESVGLIKMDFLGLQTLAIIKETLNNIRKTRDEEIDIDHIPIDDAQTYKLFAEGKTIATFQFESAGMRKYLRELKPTVLTDLIAMNALYRPGPMEYIPSFIARKAGREAITYDLPCMEKYLNDTYGITVYQEQVMLLSREIAGFTRGQSDMLRKAMGKKIAAMLAELKPKFIEGGKKNGYPAATLNKIWKDWEAFASYAFNKSHATCYAWVAYQTGYLKAHYPAEFMAANLTLGKDDIKKVTVLMDECRAMGINVLSPDVNESDLTFVSNASGDIRFGLGGIKGMGDKAVEAIIEERKQNGKYKSIIDFMERINLQACNRKSLESLTIAGAFDCFGIEREQLLATDQKGEVFLDALIRYANNYQNAKNMSVNSLFGDFESASVEIRKPELPLQFTRMSTIERLNKEKDLIGIFLSAHPLDDYQFEVEKLCNITTKELAYFDSFRQPAARLNFEIPEDELSPHDWLEEHAGKPFTLGGLITHAADLVSANNNPYGRYTIEDYAGSFEFPLFGQTYTQFRSKMMQNVYVAITGTVQPRGANFKYYKPKPEEETEYEFSITQVELLQDVQASKLNMLRLYVPIENITPQFTNELLQQCTENPGTCKLQVVVVDSDTKKGTVLNSTLNIRIDKTFYRYLRKYNKQEIFSYEVE